MHNHLGKDLAYYEMFCLLLKKKMTPRRKYSSCIKNQLLCALCPTVAFVPSDSGLVTCKLLPVPGGGTRH